MQAEASKRFLTGTIRGESETVAVLQRKNRSQLAMWERGHDSRMYEQDIKLQGQVLLLSGSARSKMEVVRLKRQVGASRFESGLCPCNQREAWHIVDVHCVSVD